jgi:NAD(P)-dependent dehydrogenase (short-subunit alcohol dehydrogenase family)
LFVYQPAKHGVLGLLRSTRKSLHSVHGIRINVLCPSLISTAIASRIQRIWEENGLPINTAAEVADYALTLTASPVQPNGAAQSGLVMSVEGGKGWEIESELDTLENQWMGDELARSTAETNRALRAGSSWTTKRPKAQ